MKKLTLFKFWQFCLIVNLVTLYSCGSSKVADKESVKPSPSSESVKTKVPEVSTETAPQPQTPDVHETPKTPETPQITPIARCLEYMDTPKYDASATIAIGKAR